MSAFASGHHVLTASGGIFAYGRPHVSRVSIVDIAAHLAKQCRFAGATGTFYSVAQHSVLVADILSRETQNGKLALYGLLSSAHDAYLGEITKPARRTIADAVGYDVIALLAQDCDDIIYPALGFAWPLNAYQQGRIAEAHATALATERRDLMPDSSDDWGPLPEPWKRAIKPLPWPKAEELFLKRWSDLCALHRHEVAA